eukprot:56357-Chlamydomonas_euryale.AAC.8
MRKCLRACSRTATCGAARPCEQLWVDGHAVGESVGGSCHCQACRECTAAVILSSNVIGALSRGCGWRATLPGDCLQGSGWYGWETWRCNQ